MNKEEIKEAIEIIKEPITVNCIDYKYFTQEQYNKLISVYENAQWLIDLLKKTVNQLETELAKYKLRETALNKLNERIGLNAIHGNVYGKTYDELVEILERGKE